MNYPVQILTRRVLCLSRSAISRRNATCMCGSMASTCKPELGEHVRGLCVQQRRSRVVGQISPAAFQKPSARSAIDSSGRTLSPRRFRPGDGANPARHLRVPKSQQPKAKRARRFGWPRRRLTPRLRSTHPSRARSHTRSSRISIRIAMCC
jgi:hypothetical protein